MKKGWTWSWLKQVYFILVYSSSSWDSAETHSSVNIWCDLCYYFSLLAMLLGGIFLLAGFHTRFVVVSFKWCAEVKIASFQAPFHYCFSLRPGGSDNNWWVWPGVSTCSISGIRFHSFTISLELLKKAYWKWNNGGGGKKKKVWCPPSTIPNEYGGNYRKRRVSLHFWL